MSSKKIRFILSAVFLFLTGSILRVAYLHNLWTEFWVTEIQLLATTAVLWFLLVDTDEKQKAKEKA